MSFVLFTKGNRDRAVNDALDGGIGEGFDFGGEAVAGVEGHDEATVFEGDCIHGAAEVLLSSGR